jgi:hypothetical protein
MASQDLDADDNRGESWHAIPVSDLGGEAPICPSPTQTGVGDQDEVLSSSPSSVNWADISNMAEYVFLSHALNLY